MNVYSQSLQEFLEFEPQTRIYKHKKENSKTKKEIKKTKLQSFSLSAFRPCKTFRKHQIITSHVYLETRCPIRCPISALSDAVEVMKLDRRTSKTMLQEENDIKDVVAASSSKPELGFHSKIHQYLQTPPRQCLTRKWRLKRHRCCRYRQNIWKGFRP